MAKKAAKKPVSNESKVRAICKILGVEFGALETVRVERQRIRIQGDEYGEGFSISVKTNH